MKLWPSAYRARNERLLMGSIVLCLLGYFLSVRPTLDLVHQQSQLESELQQAMEAPALIEELKASLAQYHQLDTAESSLSLQRDLLALSSRLCKKYNLSLQKLDHLDPLRYEQAVLERYELQLEGSFHKQVQALKELEELLRGATVSSVVYELQEDRRNKKTILVSYIHIQRFGREKL